MSFREKSVFFLGCFLDGMIVPLMSLIYLSHGATIENLAIFIAIYSIIVIVMEVPSGMVADIFGRKKIFILSHSFLMAYYFTTLVSNTAPVLLAANIFHGIGRACGSGSLEALLVEKAVAREGEDNLKRINSQILVLNSVALAAGAISGGMLGTIESDYNVLLKCMIILECIVLFMAGIFIKENHLRKAGDNTKTTLKTQIQLMQMAMTDSVMTKMILYMSVTLAMNLTLVEVYWQQKLLHLLSENTGWLFGVVSCIGYAGLVVGSKLGEHISINKNVEKIFWIFRAILSVIILILGQSFSWYIFVIVYALTYIIWGIGDLQEGIIFHQSIGNEYRAGMLSVKSLFVKGGCVLTSILSSVIIYYGSLKWVWTIIPLLTLGMTVVGIKVRWKESVS